MRLAIEPFDPARHKRGAFESGTPSIDNYLKLTARKLREAHAAAVFVVADEEGAIIGYYALSALLVDASEMAAGKSKKLFEKFGAVPATLLAMLGVDKHWQGQGIGKMLLADALRRSYDASTQVGSHCVILDVLQDADTPKRLALYQGLGFRRCDTQTGVRMFLTMADIGAGVALPAQHEERQRAK